MRRTMLSIAFLLLVAPAALTAQALTRAQADAIAEVFADFGDDTPGASVAVIREGTVIYSAGFGSAQLEYGVPISPTTIFHVASVSKQFTAMGVLLLEAEGKLSLDDDVRMHMPEVPDMGSVVTVRHILHHTSGVRDQWELLGMAGWRLDDVITKEHVRRLLRNQQELNFEPGAEYMYSNMGFSLAADLVERVSGMPFSQFMEERVFGPLDMTRTHVHDDHEMVVPGRSYSYRGDSDGYDNAVLSFANHGATSLFTTADDLVHWLDNFRHQRIGGASVLARMTTRGVLNNGDTISYALGISTGGYRGASTIGHGGSDAGFRSNVTWFPEHDVGIAVLSNLASANPGLRTRQVADVVLGDVLEPVPEPEAEPEPEPEPEDRVEVEPEVLAMYEGRFTTELAPLVFAVREGVLWVTAPEEGELVARSENTFAVPGADALITFHTRDGAADSITVLFGGNNVPGTRVEVVELDEESLLAYSGTYYSPEIETLYRIRVQDGGLTLYHLKHGELALSHSEGDEFVGPSWPFGEIRFTRGDDGSVVGMRLTGGRVRNLRFVKMQTPLPH